MCFELLYVVCLLAFSWQAVKNLIENTCQAAFDHLVQSTHDIPFAFGPYGESFCQIGFMFLGSVGKLDPAALDPELQAGPLPNEPFISIDWNLPMTEEAQTMLFKRVRTSFDRVSWMVPMHQRKKYRMTVDELSRTRNMVALFCQLHAHMKANLSEAMVQKWVHDVQEGLNRDEDLLQLMHSRPTQFAMSMLLSEQDHAKKNMEDFEIKKVEKVQQQRLEVANAQWNFFKAALEQDQGLIKKVQAAPRQVRQRLHVKQVAHRSKMIATGEQGCLRYQERMRR